MCTYLPANTGRTSAVARRRIKRRRRALGCCATCTHREKTRASVLISVAGSGARWARTQLPAKDWVYSCCCRQMCSSAAEGRLTASAITEREREPGCRSVCHCRRRACVAALLTSSKLHLRVRAYAKMPSLAVFRANTTCLWRGNSAATASLPVPKSSQGCLRANTRTPKALLQMMHMRICAYARMRICAYAHNPITS